MIELKHVYKAFKEDQPVLKNINLSIQQGEFVFITGPSGAGKSTLFKLMTGQLKPTSGAVKILNDNLAEKTIYNIHEVRQKMGVIFQDNKLIHEWTCFENIALVLKNMSFSIEEKRKKILDVIDLIGISPAHLDCFPEELSGGEQQKIALARALVHKPQVIIADEPTGNVDKQNALQFLAILKELAEKNITVLLATHDENLLAQKKGCRVITINKGEIFGDQIL